MHRILTLTLVATLASLMTAVPVHAKSPDKVSGIDDKNSDDPDHRQSRTRKHKRLRRGPDRRVAEIPAVFRKTSPHKTKKLRRMAEHRPEQYRHIIRRIHRMAQEMQELKLFNMDEFEQRIEMMELEDQVERLADQLRGTKSDNERKQLKQQLAEKLGQLFDHKEAAQRMRIEHMEKELKELETRLSRRHRMRSKIIERRLNELSGGGDLEF